MPIPETAMNNHKYDIVLSCILSLQKQSSKMPSSENKTGDCQLGGLLRGRVKT